MPAKPSISATSKKAVQAVLRERKWRDETVHLAKHSQPLIAAFTFASETGLLQSLCGQADGETPYDWYQRIAAGHLEAWFDDAMVPACKAVRNSLLVEHPLILFIPPLLAEEAKGATIHACEQAMVAIARKTAAAIDDESKLAKVRTELLEIARQAPEALEYFFQYFFQYFETLRASLGGTPPHMIYGFGSPEEVEMFVGEQGERLSMTDEFITTKVAMKRSGLSSSTLHYFKNKLRHGADWRKNDRNRILIREGALLQLLIDIDWSPPTATSS